MLQKILGPQIRRLGAIKIRRLGAHNFSDFLYERGFEGNIVYVENDLRPRDPLVRRKVYFEITCMRGGR